ncbi:hypothetical protein HCN44_000414 [Aphidius gifuensis]|uniref:Uncharacterized protein n=1 Tax=Aphidius gifuensis TaxID=684658 RepID=A0A834XSS6_APHGI|nr:hypothetical protein HCN44_000414 [Aphidius gifuensis]
MSEQQESGKILRLKGIENWAIWKFQMRISFLASKALGIVEGENPKPHMPEEIEDETLAARQANIIQFRNTLREWEDQEGKAQKLINNKRPSTRSSRRPSSTRRPRSSTRTPRRSRSSSRRPRLPTRTPRRSRSSSRRPRLPTRTPRRSRSSTRRPRSSTNSSRRPSLSGRPC